MNCWAREVVVLLVLFRHDGAHAVASELGQVVVGTKFSPAVFVLCGKKTKRRGRFSLGRQPPDPNPRTLSSEHTHALTRTTTRTVAWATARLVVAPHPHHSP